jgi:hypothetical protein
VWALVTAAAIGGAFGPSLFGAGAATSTSTTSTTTTGTSAGTLKSNENPSHEAGESAAREAAENNGTAGFPHGGRSNESASHEAGENAAREAAENGG